MLNLSYLVQRKQELEKIQVQRNNELMQAQMNMQVLAGQIGELDYQINQLQAFNAQLPQEMPVADEAPKLRAVEEAPNA